MWLGGRSPCSGSGYNRNRVARQPESTQLSDPLQNNVPTPALEEWDGSRSPCGNGGDGVAALHHLGLANVKAEAFLDLVT